MSVDITRMTEHLSPAQQQAVRKAYRQRAQSETAAFLWCFFLGVAGAHRMYLGQWRRAIAHLALFIGIVAVVVAGVVLGWSPAVIAAIAVPLLLIALVWVVVDLFRIDDEVARRNLALAEKLTGEAMLDDPARERQAIEVLAAVEERETALPVAVAAAVTVSPDDPHAVAEAAVATPDTIGVGAGTAEPLEAEPLEGEAATPAAPEPYPLEAAPVAVQTVTGVAGLAEGEGYRVVSPDEAASAPAFATSFADAEPASEYAVVETGAAWSAETAAAAAAVDAATSAALTPLYRAAGDAPAPSEWPVAQEPVAATVQEHTLADLAAGEAPAADDTSAAEPAWYGGDGEPSAGFFDPSMADAATGAASIFAAEYADSTPAQYADSAPALVEVAGVGSGRAGAARDMTDLGHDGVRFTPISDIEPGSAWQMELDGAPVPAAAPTAGDAALLLVPESSLGEPAPVWPPSPAEWPAADATSEPVAESEPATSETLAELAPFAGAALGGGFVAHEESRPEEAAVADGGAVEESAADQAAPAAAPLTVPIAADPAPMAADATPAAPELAAPELAAPELAAPATPAMTEETPHHLLKHIRVVRQVKVGDEVVEESVAEAYVSPDEDPEPVRQRLREQLRREAEEKRQRESRQ
jgi:TM2 domain-containing membrane protein YozV